MFQRHIFLVFFFGVRYILAVVALSCVEFLSIIIKM